MNIKQGLKKSTPNISPKQLREYKKIAADLKLLPEESIVFADYLSPYTRLPRPAEAKALRRLARVEKGQKIGDKGPVIAACAMEDTGDKADFHKYEAIFGRDSLRVAIDLTDIYPDLTRATLIKLAELQGIKNDTTNEEEPGKIIHESRSITDKVAQELTLTRGWAWPYYGSIDSTLMFISAFAQFFNTTKNKSGFLNKKYRNREKIEYPMIHAFDSAVSWLTKRLDFNPDGLLEYKSTLPKGIENQVWKDSWDSYFHKNGKIANHKDSIAAVEVQVMAYDALLDAVHLYRQINKSEAEIGALVERANFLKNQILNIFWTEDESGYFVIGTDRGPKGELRQLKIKTSNMGHVLNSRLLESNEPEIIRRRELTIKQLFSDKLLAASGIRTLASDEVRFRPGSYHNGSVWLWDTYYIAKGLDRHGYYKLAADLKRRIQNVINISQEYPEFAQGDDSDFPSLNNRIVDVWDEKYQRANRLEQPPQQIQAWTVSAAVRMKRENVTLKTNQPVREKSVARLS